MSRAYEDDGWDSPDEQWRCIMYNANVKRALRGKRGEKNLRIILEELKRMETALWYTFPEWMPQTNGPRLAGSAIYKNGDVCVVGAFLRAKLPPNTFRDVTRELDPEDEYGVNARNITAEAGKRAGLQGVLGEYLSAENDYDGYETPEHRFRRMKAFIEGELANPASRLW